MLETRTRAREALRQKLALPDPFDLTAWCDNLAARRERPIRLAPATSEHLYRLTGDAGVHAWVIGVSGVDHIFYKVDLAPFLRDHNVIHECCHLACDHAVPDLPAWDLGRLHEICLRRATHLHDPALARIEAEAEAYALQVEEYRAGTGTARLSDDPRAAEHFARIASFFGDRLGAGGLAP